MTKKGTNALKQKARRVANCENIPYSEALARLTSTAGSETTASNTQPAPLALTFRFDAEIRKATQEMLRAKVDMQRLFGSQVDARRLIGGLVSAELDMQRLFASQVDARRLIGDLLRAGVR